MAFLDSIPEIVVGVAVEAAVLVIASAVVYRALSGRFLVPKREIILPNQLGVLVQGDQVLRVARAGSCWVKPCQRLVLVDARPRPLQMLGVDAIASDFAIIRLSLSGQYQIADAATYYNTSTNAAEALLMQIRRSLFASILQQSGDSVVVSPELLAAHVRESVEPYAVRLGLTVIQLDVWEALPMGFLRDSVQPKADEIPPGMVH